MAPRRSRSWRKKFLVIECRTVLAGPAVSAVPRFTIFVSVAIPTFTVLFVGISFDELGFQTGRCGAPHSR